MQKNIFTTQENDWELEDFLSAKSEENQEILIHKDGRSALLITPYDEVAHESLLEVSWGMGFSDVIETGSLDPYRVETGTSETTDVNYFLLVSPIEEVDRDD